MIWLSCRRRDGRLIVSLFRGQPRALPFAVSMLERHPLGSQAFAAGRTAVSGGGGPARRAAQPGKCARLSRRPGQG